MQRRCCPGGAPWVASPCAALPRLAARRARLHGGGTETSENLASLLEWIYKPGRGRFALHPVMRGVRPHVCMLRSARSAPLSHLRLPSPPRGHACCPDAKKFMAHGLWGEARATRMAVRGHRCRKKQRPLEPVSTTPGHGGP